MDKSPWSWAKINGWEGEGDWKWRLTLRAKSWKSPRGHYLPHSLADQCRDKPKNRHFETKLNQTTFPSSFPSLADSHSALFPQGVQAPPPRTTSEPRPAWLQDGFFGVATSGVPGEGAGSDSRSQAIPEYSLFQSGSGVSIWVPVANSSGQGGGWHMLWSLAWTGLCKQDKGIPEIHIPVAVGCEPLSKQLSYFPLGTTQTSLNLTFLLPLPLYWDTLKTRIYQIWLV